MQPRNAAGMRGEDAVVIGGSMAGLLTARVLAGHFERVTVVERDHFPDGPTFRKGVPQSRHLHILLARGLEIISRFFPGIDEDLLAKGATSVEWPREVLWLTARGWSDRFATGIRILCGSRELVEWSVRRRLAAVDNVRFLTGRDVTGLLASAGGRQVAGVRLRTRPSAEGETGPVEELRAGLVVDASGRNSRAPEWLAELGYARPVETKVNSFLGYASRYYAIPPGFDADWRILYLMSQPPANARAGALFPMEGNHWIVTLAGAGRDYPPTDEDGFLAFARSLRSPLLYETIRHAEPLTPIHGYQRTENQRRFYETLPRMPERFLVTGDAICAFNPIYGQGMTAAAHGALALDRLLREGAGDDLTGLPLRVLREVTNVNAGAWLVATGEDLRYPTTEGGERSFQTRLTHRYLDRVVGAATKDQTVNRAFGNVLQLVAPPTSLFRPRILVPALLRGGSRDVGPPPTATETGAWRSNAVGQPVAGD